MEEFDTEQHVDRLLASKQLELELAIFDHLVRKHRDDAATSRHLKWLKGRVLARLSALRQGFADQPDLFL